MAQPTTVATLLSRNKDYSAHHHDPPPTFTDMRASKVAPPRVVIVSCLDPRASPERFLQLEPGSREAAIVRNLGGRAAECVNDIVALDTLVGLEEVMVVHHTGMFTPQKTLGWSCVKI
jgi:carbonic anhydrase